MATKSRKWNRKRHVHFSPNIRLSAEESFRSGFLLIARAVANAYSHPGPHHLSPNSISPSDLVRMLACSERKSSLWHSIHRQASKPFPCRARHFLFLATLIYFLSFLPHFSAVCVLDVTFRRTRRSHDDGRTTIYEKKGALDVDEAKKKMAGSLKIPLTKREYGC